MLQKKKKTSRKNLGNTVHVVAVNSGQNLIYDQNLVVFMKIKAKHNK